MNGESSPSTGEPDAIVSCDANIKYGEKKKLSLTLPLLNVILTNAASEDDDTADSNENSDDAPGVNMNSESNKKKQIYESDDTFIQTIFSQTIKSTTATPTDDEPSQSFETFKQPSKSNPDENDATTSDTAKAGADAGAGEDDKTDEPAAIYTYFHQTIEEDDSPDIDATNNTESFHPINTLTTTILPHNQSIQFNISAERKDESSEKDASLDNSLNNTSTAFASNEAISESENSLTQLNSLESDVSVCAIANSLQTKSIFNHNYANSIYKPCDVEINCAIFNITNPLLVFFFFFFLFLSCLQQSESQNGEEQIIVASEKSSSKKKSSADSDNVKNGTEKKKKSKKSKKSADEKENISVVSAFRLKANEQKNKTEAKKKTKDKSETIHNSLLLLRQQLFQSISEMLAFWGQLMFAL